MTDCSVLADTRDKVGESPVWSVVEQALYWVDIEGRFIRRFDWASGRVQSFATPERVGCIGLRRGGGLVAAMQTGVFIVSLSPGDATNTTRDDTADEIDSPSFGLLAAANHPAPDMRFNDGRCDPVGRLWVGTMVMDMSLSSQAGALFRLSSPPVEAAMTKPVVDKLIVPNGLAFSPDGKTMYLSDSHPSVQAIWRFDFDLESGTASDRRLFVDMNIHPGRPDGAAVDEDGCYWSCGNDAGMVHRFTPAGKLDRSVAVPVSKPAMCAFGGPGLDTLFITSIRPAQAAATHPGEMALAGAVFTVQVGTRGLEEPMFG